MAWEVPVTIQGEQHKFRFDGDSQPTENEVNDAVKSYLSPSWEKSFAGGAGRSAIPAYLGTLGGEGGAAVGAALAPETGGLSLALPIAGAIIGGLSGYAGGKSVQDYAIDRIAPDSFMGSKAEQADVETNPGSEMLGSFMAMGSPNPSSLFKAGESVLTPYGRKGLQDVFQILRKEGPEAAQASNPQAFEALNHVLHIASNAGVGAVQGAMEGQTPSQIALNTAGMTLFNDGWLKHPHHEVNSDRFATAMDESMKQEANKPEEPPQPSPPPEPTNQDLEDLAVHASNNPTSQAVEGAAAHADSAEAPVVSQVLQEISEDSKDRAFVKPFQQEAEDLVKEESKPEPQNEEVQNQPTTENQPVRQTGKPVSEGGKQEAGGTARTKPVPKKKTPQLLKEPQPSQQQELQEWQDALTKAKGLNASKSVIDHLQGKVDELKNQPEQGNAVQKPETEGVVSRPPEGTKKPRSRRGRVGQGVEGEETSKESQNQEIKQNENETNEANESTETTPLRRQGNSGETSGESSKIVSASFERGGVTYEGKNHNEARSAAGLKRPVQKRESRETPQYGFVMEHPDGITEVIPREEANSLAQQNGQLKEGADVKNEQLHSDHIEGELHPDNDRKIVHLNDVKDEEGQRRWDSKEEFDTEYSQEHYKDGDIEETPQEFLMRRNCGG